MEIIYSKSQNIKELIDEFDIYLGSKSFKWEINNWIIDLKHKKKIKWPTSNKLYDSYEDALSICLIEMLKLI